MPTYAEEKGIRTLPPKDSMELKQRVKELESKLKEKEKEIVIRQIKCGLIPQIKNDFLRYAEAL